MEEGELAFSYTVTGVDRFQVNAFRQRGSVSVLMRFIPLGVSRFEDLNLPEAIVRLTRAGRGITLLRRPPAVAS